MSRERASDVTLPLIVPECFPAMVAAFSTTRIGGVSAGVFGGLAGVPTGLNLGAHVGDNAQHVATNRQRLQQRVPQPLRWLNQVHGANVLDAATMDDGDTGDACYAVGGGSACAVLTADCLPVLFADVEGRVVAAAHAGWRGLAAGVLQKTILAMRARGAKELIAWMGPAIGPRTFEVGYDVYESFCRLDPANAESFVPTGELRKYRADIYFLARCAMQSQPDILTFGGGYCTVSDPGKFYSFRRDGQTGRMASVIYIRHSRQS